MRLAIEGGNERRLHDRELFATTISATTELGGCEVMTDNEYPIKLSVSGTVAK